MIGAASASSVTETSDPEMTALRRSFRLGGLAVVAAIVAIGGIIAAFGTPADRPAGVAERWLVALSDTTRDGLEDDAIERMEELTIPLEGGLARFLEPDAVGLDSLFVAFPTLADDRGAAADGEGRFETVQVGRADTLDDLVRDGHALVPVQVTPYDADDPVDGYVQLQDTDHGWRVGAAVAAELADDVFAFASPVCDPQGCIGFPIERPERAPIGFWFGAILLGALITVGCSAAIRAATPKGALAS